MFDQNQKDPMDMDYGLEDEVTEGGSGRGFAGMDPEKQRKIASKGGKAAHRKGTAHEWDSDEATEAGRRGGQS